MRKYSGLIIFFCSIVATILVLFKLKYISLIISILSLVFCLVFFKKNRLSFVTIIISICCIITNILILYNEYKDNVDILEDNNILLGSWSYNDIGGTYVFNDDYSYYQYISSNTLDNYCVGKYEYKYGGMDDEGYVIKNDEFYYYYTLYLNTEYCIINGSKDEEIVDSEFVFSVNRNDFEDIMFMDIDNDNVFKINRVK